MSSSSAIRGESYSGHSLFPSSRSPTPTAYNGYGQNTFSSSTHSVLPPLHPHTTSTNMIPLNQINQFQFAMESVDNTLKDIGRAMIDYFNRDKTSPSSSNKEYHKPDEHMHDNDQKKDKPNGKKRKRRESKKKVEEQESDQMEEKIKSHKKILVVQDYARQYIQFF